MPKSQISRETKSNKGVPHYKKRTGISYREYSPGKIIWRSQFDVYELEEGNQEDLDRLDHKKVEGLFDKENAEPKTSSLLLTSFHESTLLRLISESDDVVIKSHAIEELLRKESDGLPTFLVQELAKNKLRPSWRNTLLLTAEHVEFADLGQREELRECLKLHSKNMKGEWHHRTQSALRASVRILSSLMGDYRDSHVLLTFLILDYPVRIKRIALLGIQDLFRNTPPPPETEEVLNSLKQAITNIAQSYLTLDVYSETEEEFDLGLDALDTMIKLAEPSVSNLIDCVTEFSERWTIEQIQKTLSTMHEIWLKSEFTNKEACIKLVVECKNILDSK